MESECNGLTRFYLYNRKGKKVNNILCWSGGYVIGFGERRKTRWIEYNKKVLLTASQTVYKLY